MAREFLDEPRLAASACPLDSHVYNCHVYADSDLGGADKPRVGLACAHKPGNRRARGMVNQPFYHAFRFVSEAGGWLGSRLGWCVRRDRRDAYDLSRRRFSSMVSQF